MKTLTIILFVVLSVKSAFGSEISEAEVRTFFDTWLKAQNTGSFSNYAGMYAAKFHGIKRSGSRTYGYDHGSWLDDRKRMFSNKMTVTASNIKVQISDETATIQFEQTWESNTYKDKGNKYLYLIRDKVSLKIAREEMLASKIAAENYVFLSPANFKFAFSIKEGIVVKEISANSDLVKGKPFLTTKEPHHVSTASVNTDLLPNELKSLLGMKVRLYSSKGSCESAINGFKIVSKDVPHFGYVQRWKDEKTPNEKIARSIFSEGKVHLVATTVNCSGDFATDAKLPHVPISRNQTATGTLRNKIVAAFRALPLYKEEIKPFENEIESTNVRKFSLPFNGKNSTWVSMFIIAGEPFCGRDGGMLGSLWEVVETAKSQKLKWVKYLDEDPDYATDTNNDGIPEFHYIGEYLTGFGFIDGKRHNGVNRFFEESTFHDCPC